MSNIWKRSLSMVLALVLMFGMLPMNAMAAEQDGTETTPTEPTEHTHAYEAVVTTAATCTAEGVMTYTCACTDTYTEVIPATGHTYANGVCACGAEEPVVEPTTEPTEAPTVDPAVAEVQAMIDALDTTIESEEDALALEAAMAAAADAAAELYTEQAEQLNWSNYQIADAAVDAWFNTDHSKEVYTDAKGYFWVGNNLYIKDGLSLRHI